jgi:CheY-like chemotaxis protein
VILVRSRIVSVSCNARNLAARHILLERAGFDVTSVASTFDALDLLASHEFSAVVVGYEFSFTEKQLFAADVSERWNLPIVVLRANDVDAGADDDATEATKRGEGLIKSLNSMLEERLKRFA